MLDNTIVGNQIASLRKQNNLTQDELAEKLGITAQAISKWENGHTLPETMLLPLLSEIFHCSIDSILMPFAERDAQFHAFVKNSCGQYSELAMQLYQKLKDKFNFTVAYADKFYVFEEEFNGGSAAFNRPDKEDFIIRIDVSTKADGVHLSVRVPIEDCSSYIHLIDEMPEHVKSSFRCTDCNSCTCSCPYLAAYTFEGVDYKQCHFITLPLNSVEMLGYILTLACAQCEASMSDKLRA
jgi:transcriptional regulator with XRE-family HTH domain